MYNMVTCCKKLIYVTYSKVCLILEFTFYFLIMMDGKSEKVKHLKLLMSDNEVGDFFITLL
jgi:hypothetical protein